MKNSFICFLFCLLLFTFSGYTEPLTVVTLDAWDGLKDQGFFTSRSYEEDDERAFRMDIMASSLAGLDADLAVLTGLNGLPKAAEELSADLGYLGLYGINRAGYRIGVVGFPWNLREGSVMLARESLSFEPFDMKRFSGLFIKNTLAAARGTAPLVLGGKISRAGRDIYIFSVHWPGSSGNPEVELEELTDSYLSRSMDGGEYVKAVKTSVERNEQSLSLAYSTLGHINSLAGESAVILAGSFNVPPGSREMEVLQQAGFKDAWAAAEGPGYTLDGEKNLNIRRFFGEEAADRRERFDYILYRGEGMAVESAELVFDVPTFGVHPSDRFGLYAKFDILPASE